MKYTILEKIVSVVKNFFTTHPSQYGFFLRWGKVAKDTIEDRFSGDLTKESDYDSRDYTLDGTEDIKEHTYSTIHMIDQGQVYRMRNSCVPLSMYLGLCHNCKITPSHKEFRAILDYVEKEKVWWESRGASAPNLIKVFVKEYNRLHPDNQVEYRRVFYNSKGYKELYDKGYMLEGGRKTFTAYTRDVLDRIINFFGYDNEKRIGGHYINIKKASFVKKCRTIEILKNEQTKEHFYDRISGNFNEDEVPIIINQYPTTKSLNKTNLYAHTQMDSHTKRGIWYSRFYCILKVEKAPKKKSRVEETEVKEVKGEYRKLAGESFINNPMPFVKAIREGTDDEAISALQIITNLQNEKVYGMKKK